jgi:hypothetical protein
MKIWVPWKVWFRDSPFGYQVSRRYEESQDAYPVGITQTRAARA